MRILTLLVVLLLSVSCGSSKMESQPTGGTEASLDEKNSAHLPLMTRIRRIPGITVQGGKAYFIKSGNSFSSANSEPLYVLNGMPIGNSFALVRDQVLPAEIISVKGVTGPDAASYGARGASGVIEIKTKT